ncbi:hypothetical protein [Salinisphaera sp.]|uniref:hypothetical protein n=1 Tax=Salinisphaera sp. TaxID=1914330 RepID=UPI000C5A0EE7|nr:hypothetical protein [Salinisphaera sp.]MBS62187.1 hypothetical protein [Salinisphaera sp.]
MNGRLFSASRLVSYLALCLCLFATQAFAQNQNQGQNAGDQASAADAPPQRPVYLDIVPVADARYSMLPEELVTSLARESLSGARQATIRMAGEELPTGVRVLRIMYIVHQQEDETGVTAAVAASTELLRTAREGDGGPQTFSIYNGLQQTLVQGPDVTRAREKLREAFKKELQERIASAFQNAEALK